MDPVCVPDTVVLLSTSIMCTPGPGLYTTQQHALQTLQGTWKRLIEYGDEQLVFLAQIVPGFKMRVQLQSFLHFKFM